jgi:site-specific DNA recombinase
MEKKGIGYIRVSTLKQIKGHSLDYQRDEIEKYCKRKEIELKKLFIDKGLSGYKYRPKFKEMNEYIEKNDVDFVITYSITRYGRSTQDLLYHINYLEDKDVKFVSIKEQVDVSTKTGRLLLGMLALIADFEAETIRERMEAGRAWAEKHGTKSGKPIGRPKADIDWSTVKNLREKKVSWNKTAELVGVSTPTLIKRAKEEGIY